MKGKFYTGILALLLLLAGCDKADVGRGENDGKGYPVSFTLAELRPMRAADGDATDLQAGTALTIAAYNPNSGKLVAARQYKVNSAADGLELDGSITDNEPMYLPVGTYDFCAMTPVQTLTGEGKHGTVAQGTDAFGSVTRAQMGADATTIPLNNLDHLASQISFTVQVVKQEVDSVVSFAVQSIEIEGMVKATTDNYLLPENKLVIPAIEETDRFEKLTIDGSDAFTAGEKGDGSGPGYINTQKTPRVVFPKAESTFNAIIKVKIQRNKEAEATDRLLSVKINRLAFEPGKRYLFEVNYGWDYVRFNITVAPWTTVTDDSEVGGGVQTVTHTININPWGEDIKLDMDI